MVGVAAVLETIQVKMAGLAVAVGVNFLLALQELAAQATPLMRLPLVGMAHHQRQGKEKMEELEVHLILP
jgi:hypothetical protein